MGLRKIHFVLFETLLEDFAVLVKKFRDNSILIFLTNYVVFYLRMGGDSTSRKQELNQIKKTTLVYKPAQVQCSCNSNGTWAVSSSLGWDRIPCRQSRMVQNKISFPFRSIGI